MSYLGDELRAAVMAVLKERMSERETVRNTRIPWSRSRRTENLDLVDFRPQNEHLRIFTSDEKRLLCDYIKTSVNIHYGSIKVAAWRLAYQFAIANNKQTNVAAFLNNFATIKRRFKFDSQDIHILDETGQLAHTLPKVLDQSSKKQVSQIISAERNASNVPRFMIYDIAGIVVTDRPFVPFAADTEINLVDTFAHNVSITPSEPSKSTSDFYVFPTNVIPALSVSHQYTDQGRDRESHQPATRTKKKQKGQLMSPKESSSDSDTKVVYEQSLVFE
ncbi:hypothetical protein ILUMI_12585 [Ignelater luminosus]|uniref:DDE-1 domain-containing protein n=1 Tax=Ignelater luminosus TaxID=2038154 RepID=A0A8K0CU02_IGNLU|nr:hypothetical protein ILUMI_12585 [Ignelater luminosus]